MGHDFELSLPDVFTRHQALAAGGTRHQLEWALKSGRWLALRRGTYCRRDEYDAADPIAQHLLHSRAALVAHDERHVLSHLSAALSFGLPGPLGGAGRPTLTLGGPPASTDRQDDLIVQVATLRGHDIERWGSARRTSMARTLADCLRHLPAPDAVAIADAGLRVGETTVACVREILDWQQGWPYLAHGLAAFRLVDGRRESWLESFAFVTLHGQGIPLPTPQVEVSDEQGAFIARCDGLWAEHGTVAEADGRAKYALSDWDDLRAVPSNEMAEARIEAARRALVREKVREDRLRAVGLEVVRFGTYDILQRRTRLIGTIRAAWRRGDMGRFTGSLTVRAAGSLAVGSGSGAAISAI
jgi:hypothetical protein